MPMQFYDRIFSKYMFKLYQLAFFSKLMVMYLINTLLPYPKSIIWKCDIRMVAL
jgi:hypothetical protein